MRQAASASASAPSCRLPPDSLGSICEGRLSKLEAMNRNEQFKGLLLQVSY